MVYNVFNVPLEFDSDKACHKIEYFIKDGDKGYVCCVESNNLTIANKDDNFRLILNKSLLNICDGSNIALLASLIFRQKLSSFTGSDIFEYFINKNFKHYFLGNTHDVLLSLKEKLKSQNACIHQYNFHELPFLSVNDFDYEGIAEVINNSGADIIWISLGAPKQELFMAKLLPNINRGVMIGVGAVFNFYSEIPGMRRAPLLFRKFNLEWLYRAFQDPRKNMPRYWNFIIILPRLIKQTFFKSK